MNHLKLQFHEINKIFKLDHHHIGDKNRIGVSRQCAKHKELDEAPKISEFFNSIIFILIIYANEQIKLQITQNFKFN